MKRRVNVGLRYDVYARLKERGKFGETYSDVVSRMMDELGVFRQPSKMAEAKNIS
jgi:hypothetical protein